MSLAAETHIEMLTRVGRAMADPIRCQLLLALRKGPAYPADLADALGSSRSKLSNHLACLRGCGLVVAVPEGRRVRYELAGSDLAGALSQLLGLVLAVDPECACVDDVAVEAAS